MSSSNSLGFTQFEKEKRFSWFLFWSIIVHLPKFYQDNLIYANMHLRNPLDPTQASSPPSTTMILTFEGRVFAAWRRCAMQLRVIQTLPSSQTLPDITSAFPRPPSHQLGFDPVVLTSWLSIAGQTLFESLVYDVLRLTSSVFYWGVKSLSQGH